jgi:SAM-dependent methyltransferase
MRSGASFEDEEVVRCYLHRPPYPDGIFRKIEELSPARDDLLDLGCGTGKIARILCQSFGSVTAVDASRPMIEAARRLPGGDAENISWMAAPAEEAPLPPEPFDVIVAAESLHWMDHARLFPRLARHVRDPRLLIAVSGDGAFDPPWQDGWVAFLKKWIWLIKGDEYNPGRHENYLRKYEDWTEPLGEEEFFTGPVVQKVDDFITLQHSRNTFTRKRLGSRFAEFDRELGALLEPHAADGKIEYKVNTRISWGRIVCK